MPKILIFTLLFLCGAGRVGASDDREGPQGDLLFGILSPLTKIEGTGEKIGGAGIAVGTRLLSPKRSRLQFGFEIQSLNSGETNSSQIVANGNSTSKFNSFLFLGELKFSSTQGKTRPFFLAGLGIHSTNYKLETTPASGFVWTDTATRETRSTIDSRKTGLATTLQAGLDFLLSDRLRFGLVGSYYHFGKTTYDATASAKQLSPNFVGLEASIASLAFLGSVSYTF